MTIRKGILFLLFIAACDTGSSESGVDAATTTTSADAGTSADAAAVAGCDSATTHIEIAACATEAFLATLSSAELASVNLAFTDTTDRTRWSNLPGVTRAGVPYRCVALAGSAAGLAAALVWIVQRA